MSDIIQQLTEILQQRKTAEPDSSYVASLYPESGIQQPIYAGAGDIVFFLSLFVIGGEFWEKLRALFVRD